MSLRQLPVGVKLTVALIALVAISAALGYGSLRTIAGLSASLNSTLDVTGKKRDLAAGMRAGVHEMRLHAAMAELALIDGSLVGHVSDHGADMICADCHTSDKIGSNREKFDAVGGALRAQVAALGSLPLTTSESAALSAMDKGLREWQPLYAQYLESAQAHHYPAAHDVMISRIYPLVESIEKTADLLKAEEEKAMLKARDEVKERVSSSIWRASNSILLCLLIGAAVLILVHRITSVLRHASREIAAMSHEIVSATAQIASASESLAQTASEQNSSLEMTCSSSEQIRSMAQENTEHMGTASTMTRDVMEHIGDANRMLDETKQTIIEIDSSGAQVSKIVRMIDEIAFQTNILALNAAIEAARAGNAGLGFGVVADQVRGLAKRCAAAAQDTSAIIEGSIAKSSEGRTRLERLGESIHAITKLSEDINTQVGQVTDASHVQNQSVAKMAGALNQMEQVTQNISACAEENAAAGEELSTQSRMLQTVVGRLQELVG